MFCPNCGKDCADANFCSMCGTRIRAAETTDTATVVGMPFSQTDTQEDAYVFPVGCYVSSTMNSLVLGKSSLVIRKNIFGKKIEILISYDQLCSIILDKVYDKTPESGFLIVCYKGNEVVPMPGTGKNLINEPVSYVEKGYMDLVYHIFCALKTVAPASAEFSILSPSMTEERLEKLAAEVDMDACFERFSPYRDRAVEYVCNAVHIKAQEARILVDTVFDARQAEMYAENPKLAIRDLNRIVADGKRKEEEKKREREERANRRRWFLFFRF